ncbi:Solute carrier family 22 member 13 [Chionoecetes opilio]|uniref:Solute carrier family 22 member 13 n=1 Tax=Chionoecetes opilio TaxID=41210 RepID=A0A8J5CPB9_CHIOP|nr:Solute carrier family 22 member 13 [Chionoecetes opilio]
MVVDDLETRDFRSLQFGLVCDRRYLRAAHQSIYMGGMLVGAFFNGFLADRYGRLRMIAISVILYCVVALGSAWLPSLGLILTSRFLLGTMHPTSLTTGFILARLLLTRGAASARDVTSIPRSQAQAFTYRRPWHGSQVMEVTEMKWRSTAGLVTGATWSVGTILWGLFAYLERDWRWLQTFVSLLCPVMVPFLFFMDESPRWLVVMGRHKEALSVLQRAARLNGTSLPPKDHLLAVMKNVEQQSSSATAKNISQPNMARRVLNQVSMLFSTKKLITITVVSCIGFFSVALIYFGLTLGASALNIDDPFAYVAISGTMELPGILTIFLVEKIGRKKSGIGTFALCAFSLLTQPLLPASIGWLSMTLVMTGKMAAACAFDVMFLYSSELYPTEIRMQGMSAGMMASRAGAFISPFIMSALEPHYPWAISVVFGLMAAVAAVSFIPLWETANTCLPDTMLQLEAKKEGVAADSPLVK